MYSVECCGDKKSSRLKKRLLAGYKSVYDSEDSQLVSNNIQLY